MNPTVVSSILKEGLVINTRLGSNIAWYKNIVYKSEENTVFLCLLDSYLENLIMKDSKITLKYTNEYFEYLFEGIVTDIKPQHPAYISVTVQKAEELVNTRTFPRYDIYLPSVIKSIWDKKECFSIVTNVCLGGIAFMSRHEFEYGEESDVQIFLPQDKRITGRGKVIRKSSKNGLFDYSMQFVDMTEGNSITLSNYLLILDENTSSLQTNFFKNIKGLILT